MLFVDSSAVAKVFLDVEDGSALVAELLDADASITASWITYAEVRAALAAARRSQRLSRAACTTALRQLERFWASVTALVADEEICRAAGELAARHRLHGADAIQLATASIFHEAGLLVVTFDRALARAAREEGLAVAGVRG